MKNSCRNPSKECISGGDITRKTLISAGKFVGRFATNISLMDTKNFETKKPKKIAADNSAANINFHLNIFLKVNCKAYY